MVLQTLLERGMLEQVSNTSDLETLLSSKKISLYIGFDPTAQSLHVGHLLPIMALSCFQKNGHKPIIIVGGATGMIGDPSGRESERKLLSQEEVNQNCSKVKKQLEKFFNFTGENAVIIVNNFDWIGKISLIEWLREVGKYFSINYMISKESVRRRMNERDQGISYTEFSYMLLQAYDFLYLFDNYNCFIQGGGNDQWGNITTGIDLIRKVRQQEVFGITFPLVTTTGGEKFGKSAGNAIWLDEQLTSPYAFYQYWLNTSDEDVEKYLKYFTYLSLEEIRLILSKHRKTPDTRYAQYILAEETCKLVHGIDKTSKAITNSKALFGSELTDLSGEEIKQIFGNVPSFNFSKEKIFSGIKVVDLLCEIRLTVSKNEAKNLIKGGGLNINNERIDGIDFIITSSQLIANSFIVLRIGKKNYSLIKCV